MLHTVLILAHAAAGVVALAAGAFALRNGRFFAVYLASLVAMTLFLVLAVGAEWNTIDAATRVVFTAFALLAGVMVARGLLARRDRPSGSARPSPGYVEHVGFNLIALFDAFAVITVLNAGAPVWLVVGTGVLIAIAGHFALRRARTAFAAPRHVLGAR